MNWKGFGLFCSGYCEEKQSTSSHSFAHLGIWPLVWDFIWSPVVFDDNPLNSNVFCHPLLLLEATLFVLKSSSVCLLWKFSAFLRKGQVKKCLYRNYYVDNPATTQGTAAGAGFRQRNTMKGKVTQTVLPSASLFL